MNMGANQLDNCRICGTLFMKDYTDYCLDCFKNIEQEFQLVNEFLKNDDNRNADIHEVSHFTNIPVKRIIHFIRDGRIYAEDYPNLGYPCRQCGKLIKRQMLCHSCFDAFSTEIDRTLKVSGFMDKADKASTKLQTDAQYWKLRK